MPDCRFIHLPYCIKKLPSGKHVVLNRRYKPLGFQTTEHFDYEAYPITIKFKRLTGKTAAKLSYEGSENTDFIYLYNDGCVPTASAEYMRQYLERLGILAKLKLEDPD